MDLNCDLLIRKEEENEVIIQQAQKWILNLQNQENLRRKEAKEKDDKRARERLDAALLKQEKCRKDLERSNLCREVMLLAMLQERVEVYL